MLDLFMVEFQQNETPKHTHSTLKAENVYNVRHCFEYVHANKCTVTT